MKLLYVIHQFYPEFSSGTEKFLFNLCSSLQRDGHAVHVVTYTFQEQDAKSEGDLQVRGYVYKGIPVTTVRHIKVPIDINTAWAGPEVAEFAANFLRKLRPDLVHVAHPMRLGAFADPARELGIPYIITLTDFWTICPKITLQATSGNLCAGPKNGNECARLCLELDHRCVRARLDQTRRTFEKAGSVVVPSRFVGSVFHAEFPELKIRVIPHGIRRPDVAPAAKTYRAGDRLIFGYAGGFASHKGMHILLSAFRKLNGRAELRIYGSHFQQPDYLRLLQQIADQDSRIRFCGSYSDHELDITFQNLDVLVVPSVCYETYSFSVHEALSRGIPVIASQLGAIDEAVQDGVSGFLVRPGDIDDLRRKLEQVLVEPEQLNDLKARLASYTAPLLEEEAYLYERVYRSVI